METLIVDDGRLADAGGRLLTIAGQIPDAPAPFTVSGGSDRLSQTISSQIPEAEAPAINGLPPLKEDAKATAENIIKAAARYAETDADLARVYEQHQFDIAAGPSSGGGTGAAQPVASAAAGVAMPAGGSNDQMGQFGQMMGMPLQMAGQTAQMPMQAMGVAGSVPQGVQGAMQQVGQLSGQLDKSAEKKPVPAEASEERPSAATSDEGAAPGQSNAKGVPVEPPSLPGLRDGLINL